MKNPMLDQLQQKSLNNNNNNDFLQNLNPQIATIINQYGNGDPKTAFYQYAKFLGKDPDVILNMIRTFSGR